MPDVKQRVNLLLFPAVTQLDLTGPYEVLVRMPGAKIELVGASMDPVASDRGLAIIPTTRPSKRRPPATFPLSPAVPVPMTRSSIRDG